MEQQPKKRGRQARASKENEPLATVEQTTENMEPIVPKPKGKAARKKPSDEVKPSIESIKDAVTDAVKQEEPGAELNTANGEEKPATKTGGRAKKEKVTKAEVAKEPKVKRVAEKKPKGKGKATEEGAQEEAEQPPAVLQEVPLAEIEKKVRGKAAKTVKATAEAEEPTVAKTGRAKSEKNAKPAEDTKNESPKKVEKKPAPAKRGKNTKEKNPEPAADTAEEKKDVEDTNIAEVTTKKGRGKAKAAIPEVEASDQLVTKRKPKGKDVSPMATAEPTEPVAPTKTVAKLTGRGKKKAEPEANDDAPSVAKLPRVAGKGKRGAASKMVDAVPVDEEPAGAEVGAEDKKTETKESPSVRGKGNVLTNFIRKITQRKRRKVESEEEAEEPAAEPKTTAKKGKKAAATAAPKMNKCATDYSALSFEPEQSSVLWNYKISSWNVAGLRSWVGKGGLDFIEHEQPDILCLQETKCTEDQLPDEARHIKGYHPYWLCKPGGYAGVAIYSRKMPIHVSYGLGDEEQDQDGRLLTAEYEKFYLVCVYVPNAGNKLVTLPKRMRWDEKFHQYLRDLDSKKPVILCGDMNVAHEEIDLANPKTNKKNAGFTQEERDGMSKLLSFGFVDTFRQLYPDRKAAYSFWTYMGGARAKNVGWRLDYFIVSQRFADKVTDNVMRSKVYGSDHCPVTLFLNL